MMKKIIQKLTHLLVKYLFCKGDFLIDIQGDILNFLVGNEPATTNQIFPDPVHLDD